jgi:hypothetical protein
LLNSHDSGIYRNASDLQRYWLGKGQEVKTVLQDLREVLAEEVTRHYLPICVCSRCGNETEGALINRIIEFIRTGEPN